MHRKNSVYLEDTLLAERLANENKAEPNHLKPLEMAVDEATARVLNAEETRVGAEEMRKLKLALAAAISKLAVARAQPSAPALGNAPLFIETNLNMLAHRVKNQPAAKAVRVFTEKEAAAIRAHYDKLPEELQKLMDAAINDDIELDLIMKPVFIRGEGHIYNQEIIEEMLTSKKEPVCPHNDNLKFTKNDVTPCNTLIAAMGLLLDVISGEEQKPLLLDVKIASLLKGAVRQRVAAELIQLIEKHYQTMIEKHKLLFDIICRDPMTHEIMDDPIFLPDGYVYDRSTALAYLKYKEGTCPKNATIFFTEQDITPCHYVIAVLDQMKENILKKIKSAQDSILQETQALLAQLQTGFIEQINQVKQEAILKAKIPQNNLETLLNKLQENILEQLQNTRQSLQPTAQTTQSVTDSIKAIDSSEEIGADMRDHTVILPNAKLEEQRALRIQEIKKLLEEIQTKNVAEQKNIHPDMEAVLTAAIQALELVKLDILQEAKRKHPKYDLVTTMLGGEKDSSTGYGKFYRSLAQVTGRIKGQPGQQVKKLLQHVKEDLLTFAVALNTPATPMRKSTTR